MQLQTKTKIRHSNMAVSSAGSADRLIRLPAVLALLVGTAVGQARADVLYVSNFDLGTIDQISPTGAISTYATIPRASNYEIAFDHLGNLFVADPLGANGSGTVYEVAPGGSVSAFATGLGNLRGIAVDSSNNVFVSGGDTITEITPLGVATTYASGISGVFGLAFAPSGNLYASAANNNTIVQVFNNGSTSVLASNIGSPFGLTTDTLGNVYAASGDSVVKVTPSGSVSTYASGIPNATSLAFDSTGNLFVGDDFGSHQITKIAPGGSMSSTFVDDTRLNPWGLAFQPDDMSTAAVPEPTSLTLFAMAIGSFAVHFRSRRRKRPGALGA